MAHSNIEGEIYKLQNLMLIENCFGYLDRLCTQALCWYPWPLFPFESCSTMAIQTSKNNGYKAKARTKFLKRLGMKWCWDFEKVTYCGMNRNPMNFT
jgi:hypothetical protein